MDVSFQLYSAREFTPWPEVIEMLANLGYTQVEGFGGNYEDPAAFRGLLDEHGLRMPSGHIFPLDTFETDMAKVLDIAKTLGIERLFCPALPPEQRKADAHGWREVGKRLEAVGEQVRDAGLRFGWHNHDFEFATLADGGLPMDIILDTAPNIEWEADIAWIVRGGQNPIDWIERYADRITTAHVKDIASEGENTDEDGWADVGHGTMHWKTIHEALVKAGVDLFVMEHDKPADVKRFATRSIETFKTF